MFPLGGILEIAPQKARYLTSVKMPDLGLRGTSKVLYVQELVAVPLLRPAAGDPQT